MVIAALFLWRLNVDLIIPNFFEKFMTNEINCCKGRSIPIDDHLRALLAFASERDTIKADSVFSNTLWQKEWFLYVFRKRNWWIVSYPGAYTTTPTWNFIQSIQLIITSTIRRTYSNYKWIRCINHFENTHIFHNVRQHIPITNHYANFNI